MEVYKCGTKVSLTFNHDSDGVITAVSIRFERVVYEVSYFNNGEYKQVWLDKCEFGILNGEKNRIGFK